MARVRGRSGARALRPGHPPAHRARRHLSAAARGHGGPHPIASSTRESTRLSATLPAKGSSPDGWRSSTRPIGPAPSAVAGGRNLLPLIPEKDPLLFAAAPLPDALNLDISLGDVGRPRRRHPRDGRLRPRRLRPWPRARACARTRSGRSAGSLSRSLFGAFFWAWQGSDAGSQYLAGYLLERSLSLDNIFVFAVILAYFAVPAAGPGEGVGVGHHARAVPAPDLHPARRGAAGRVPRHVLLLRRAAALHGLEARSSRRRRNRARA